MNPVPDPDRIRAEFEGRSKTVSELLEFFGFRRRTYESVPVIEAALLSADLTTSPAFAKCPYDTHLSFVKIDQSAAALGDEEETDDDVSAGTLPQRSLLVRDLPSAKAEFAYVTSGNTLGQALTIMREKNLAHLPVIDGTSHLRGVITWRRVASRYMAPGVEPTLANSMDTEWPPIADLHNELFRHLPAICEHGYVLVRDELGSICGIITLTDISNRFHETTRPYFLVGDIEFRLRKLLGHLDEEAVREVQNGKNKSGKVADLQFGQYMALLANKSMYPHGCVSADKNWAKLALTVDRTMFLHRLERVRKIRNSIAHFHTTPPTADDIDQLVTFAGLLKQLE